MRAHAVRLEAAIFSLPRLGLGEMLTVWLFRRRTRRSLADMPEHLLLDIGLTRDAARSEAEKPFWRC